MNPPDNNTGILDWDLNLDSYSFHSVAQQYCFFALWNGSLETCTWGPFGVLSYSMPENSSTPLAYSVIFELLPQNTSEGSALWVDGNKEELALGVANMTMTKLPVASACPSMSISPGGIDMTTSLEFWPPLKTGIDFPT